MKIVVIGGTGLIGWKTVAILRHGGHEAIAASPNTRLAQYRSSYKKWERSMAGTTQDVLTHHLACFGKGDLDGIMADYTPASRLFTPNGVLRGTSAIRETLRDDRLGILEARNVLRDVEAGR